MTINNSIISDLTRRLKELLRYPIEKLDIEVKNWLELTTTEHQAVLAKSMLALANYGGGYILLGFEQEGNDLIPSIPESQEHNRYLNECTFDRIQGIIERYADPTFQCEIYHIEHPIEGIKFPIIRIPGGHRVPIRSKRSGPNEQYIQANKYYTRRPGPRSEPPQTAHEWNELINRCIQANREILINNIREILLNVTNLSSTTPSEDYEWNELENWNTQSNEKVESLLSDLPFSSPYNRGKYVVAYQVKGEFEILNLRDFRNVLIHTESNITGWPPWMWSNFPNAQPYTVEGVIECWFGPIFNGIPAESDYWRASPNGFMYLVRGYQEDSTDQFESGTILDPILQIWRIGECLLHAKRLVNNLNVENDSILFYVEYEGLNNRVLKSIQSSLR